MRIDKVNAKKGHIQIHQDLVIKNDVREVTRFSTFIKSALEKADIEKSLAR